MTSTFDQAVDRVLDAIDDRIEDVRPVPTIKEEPHGSSGAPPVPIPPPLRGPERPEAFVLDDIAFVARFVLQRTAAWRAAV
jgi:hypothetical protein